MAVTVGQALSHPEPAEIELSAVLHALSDPVRLRIIAGLAKGHERTCNSFQLPVTKSTCTHNFRVLREAPMSAASPEPMLGIRPSLLPRVMIAVPQGRGNSTFVQTGHLGRGTGRAKPTPN